MAKSGKNRYSIISYNLRNKNDLIECLEDFYNNNHLDTETEMAVLNFLEKLGVDLVLI